MKDDMYCQCELNKGAIYRVGWIPISFAKVNGIIDLKLNGKWSKGWRVVSTGVKVTSKYAEDRERDYKTQREASDI